MSHRRLFYPLIVFIFSFACLIKATSAFADNPSEFLPGRLLVRVDHVDAINNVAEDIKITNIKALALVPGLYIYEFDPALPVREVQEQIVQHASVIYAEPDYIYHALDTVNDPRFSDLWALENVGQQGGKIDADINAQSMWDIQKGNPNVVVGIIDTGVDYTHQDLTESMWTNSGEIAGNGRDDDNNGYIDDIHGVNAIKDNGDPMDDNIHGTHVAGTIGARGNNNLGVVGVARDIRIAACKFLSKSGSGGISDAIQCMEYFHKLKTRSQNPVNIVATNNSWGGGSSSQAMFDAIKAHEQSGILFIAAAGNESNNNDQSPSFPANYAVPNVISVAATDRFDELASFSNYGKRTVHVAAPGVKILSTVPNQGYSELSGTSMATPHVTGLAAIIASQDAALGYRGIKRLILTGGTRIPAATTTTITGRRIRGADTNGDGSLTCKNQTFTERQTPAENSVRLVLGEQIFLSAVYMNCAQIGGSFNVYSNGTTRVDLNDNGEFGDITANDGIFALAWTPERGGVYSLKFSESDTVVVNVGDHQAGDYHAHDDVAFEYTYIGGERLGAQDDTIHAIRSPFAIPFNGDSEGFFNLYISSNGTISFSDSAEPGYNNLNLPQSHFSTLIAPLWDDLIFDQSRADIYVEVLGASPHRSLVVEWWKVRRFNASGIGAFQVIFHEDSPDIRFNYLDTNFSHSSFNSGKSATVGVQTSPESALEYSYNKASVPSDKSILFSLE